MRHHRFTQSLSGRLMLLFIGTGLLFLVLVGNSIGNAFHRNFEANARPHLLQYLNYIQADIGAPPDLSRADALSRRLPVSIAIEGPDRNWSSAGAPPVPLNAKPTHSWQENGNEYLFIEQGRRFFLRVKDGPYTFTYSIAPERAAWHVAVPLAFLLAILVLLYHATRRLIAPVATLRRGVEAIGRGELDQPIVVERRDELGQLADSINTMAREIRDMLDAKRQLLLAISHELRSPLTRARVAASLVDHPAQREEIERELDSLETLIHELLETERLSSRHQVMDRQTHELTALVRDVIDALRGTRIPETELPPGPLEAEVDGARLRLMLRNLLENALRHTPPDAPVPRVRLETTDGRVRLEVRDYGPGISPEHLPHVTEPFYRADPARQRQTGGFGLGLYLCRRIAEMHDGSLELANRMPSGIAVTVELPRKAPSATYDRAS